MKKRILAIVLAASMMMSVSFVNLTNANALGDIDGDGQITATDAAIALQRAIDAGFALTDIQLQAADVIKDGVIGADDAAAILQKAIDASYIFPSKGQTEDTTETSTENTTEATTETTTETTTENTTEATTETSTEATTEATTETTTETSTEASTEATTEATTEGEAVYTANLLNGLKAGSNDDILVGLYAGENMAAAVESVPTDESIGSNYVQGTTNPTISNNIPTAGAYIRYTAPDDGVLEIKLKTTKNKTTKFVFADGSSASSDIVNTSTTDSRFDIVNIQMNSGQVLYIYAIGSKTSIFGLSFTTKGVLPTVTTESTTQGTTESTTESTTKAVSGDVDTSDGVVVSKFSELKSAVSNGEKKIYVKGTLDCTDQIALSQSNANVTIQGLTNEDGTGAILDFESFLNKATSRGESKTGVYITGSHYNLKDIIIQNAPDCGVRIKGSSAGYCTFENCVFRYNNNSGISVTSGGHDNYFANCDSYRNGDIVNKCGDDADGYSVKIGAGGGNKFYNCRAWENSDDGWDSYDRGSVVPDVYYEECLAWHNGNPETFTGEYDYEKGYPLDKNLLYVKAILKAYPDFEQQYNAHTVTEWPQVTLKYFGNTRTYSDFYSILWGGNPNGFKFGSADTPTSTYRYIKNCIAFDHFGNKYKEVQYVAKGYDQNNGSASYDLVNALSFNNKQNYCMSKMQPKSITGTVIGFNIDNDPVEDELTGGLMVETPSSEKQAELAAKVYAYRDMIYSYVYNDKIPGKQLCDVFNQ